LNNQTAEIESGTQIPVITAQTGVGGGAPTVFTTQFVSVPLRLQVTPQITDVGTVILDIVAENNTLSTTIAVGGTPGINTQRTKTRVVVPDGGTTIIGGALLDAEGEDVFRTPGLSRIPIIGYLFKRKAISRQSNEILFFITPRIVRSDMSGKPLPSKISEGTRTTTLLQPVPLGNPESNTAPTPPRQTQPQPITLPLVPLTTVQPTQPVQTTPQQPVQPSPQQPPQQ
jgi:type II secretory pathway component GspD/PulD (secretin)